jgi:CRP-like cAMP-binding protein
MARDFFSYADASADAPPETRAILGGLRDEDWDKFIAFAARRRYVADASIIKAGDGERAVYFIVSGSVRVVSAQPGGLALAAKTLGEGDVFGIPSFLDGGPHAAEAIAAGPVEVLMLSDEMFEQLASWHPRIAIAFLRDIGANVSARLRQHERTL